ncbi:hypothetical protein HDE_06064 [Halotydeus destructor]|nr:hypothetical protein HDE_06064 [Halotydeus destructor]
MTHLRLWLPFLGLVALSAAYCPEGWTNVNNIKCMKFFPEDVTAPEAVVKCATYGASPLTIAHSTEWGKEMKMVSMGGYKHAWTKDISLKFWGQKLGETCSYNMLGNVAEACPLYTFDAADNRVKRCTANCLNKHPYACERGLVGGPGAKEAEPNGYSCPDKFTAWGANCYQFLAGRHGWPVECNSQHDQDLESDLKIDSKMEEDYIRNTMANLGYGASPKVWVYAECTDKDCKYRDDPRPVTHEKVDYASCVNATKERRKQNMYWDLDSDEWRCSADLKAGEGYYSVCKTKGTRVEAQALVDPVVPSLVAEPTIAYSCAVSLSSPFIALCLVICRLVYV